MAERYEILQHIENPFVASQCPVLLLSHALTKDTETDSVFLQCKFENLNSKEIKAFYISVYCADVTGQALSGVDAFSYLDISVPQYQTFGGQVPVFLPDKESRVFSIIPDKIVYLDGSMWNKDSDIPFQPFSIKSQPIKSLGELSEQYYRELHTICAAYDKHNQLPLRKDGFTVCGCGNIVQETETQCPACGVSFEKIFSINDVNYLHRNLDQYKQEQSEREAQAKQAAEEKKQQDMLKKERLTKNAKKISIVGGSLVALIVVAALVIQVLIPSIRYGIAENAIASGKYEEAIATFEDLGEFKNASDKVKEAKYAWAESKLSDGDTEDALNLFYELDNYKNSKKQIRDILYPTAQEFSNAVEHILKTSKIGTVSASISDDSIAFTIIIPMTAMQYQIGILKNPSVKKDLSDIYDTIKTKYDEIVGYNAYAITLTFKSSDNETVLQFGL